MTLEKFSNSEAILNQKHPIDGYYHEVLRTNTIEINDPNAKDVFIKAKQIKPFTKEDAQQISKLTNTSITTDIVEFKTDDDWVKFIEYWGNTRTTGGFNIPSIPADLIVANTLPITDIRLSFNEGSLIPALQSCRIIAANESGVISQEIIMIIDMKITVASRSIKYSFVTAATVVENESGNVTIEPSVRCGLYPNSGQAFPSPHYHIQIATMQHTIRALLAIWYGVQLALTHPVVKDVFLNPVMEKRNRKEIIDYRGDANKKKTMKYVKHHYITEENSIDNVLVEALDEINSVPHKKPFTRKTLLWRVLGHYRVYPTGTKAWVNPYWKGVMRDIPNKEFFMENKREVITE